MKTFIDEPFVFPRTGKVVKNRSVLAAMTNKQSHSNGTISSTELKWLVRRAKGSFGIITTAAIHVSKDGQGWEGEIGLFSDEHIKKLKKLTSKIRKYNSLSFAQLFHGGQRAPQKITGKKPISASVNKTQYSSDGETDSVNKQKIKQIIADFTSAALRASKSGFDGIELHCAHGYLLAQFLGIKTNRRSDEYGGSIVKRSKIIFEIYKSIKKVVPESFIVGIRISPEISDMGIDLRDSISLVKHCLKLDLDFIHISCWDINARSKKYIDSDLTLTEWFTKSIKNLPPIISTGNIWNVNDVMTILDQGASLYGVGRAAIPYPDFPKLLKEKNFNPSQGPFTYEELRKVDVGDIFIDYLKSWKGFIADEP